LTAVPAELRFFFRELIRLARTYTALDDLEHYQTTRVNPVSRQAAMVLGSRLQERGVLDQPEDVFFFRKADLEELVRSYPHERAAIYRDKVYQAKRSYEESAGKTPRWSLADESTAAPALADADTLRGLPGSPGSVTGSCFLVHDPSDFARFPKG